MKNAKGNRKMRKAIIMLVTMLFVAMPLRSQVFLTQEDLDSEREGQWEDIGLIIPIHEQDFDQAEEYAPLGGGIALLAALGGAYLTGRRRKEA